ncbi:MAG: hypothetical protein ACRELY_13035 [Polyangiaceae bacterium]
MDGVTTFWFVLLLAATWCASGCWMLQVVCYPTYKIVAAAEFVPFHKKFGNLLVPVFVVPAFLTGVGLIVSAFFRPPFVSAWVGYADAALGAMILGTTLTIELPKHIKLDKDGKDDALLAGLITNNVPRVVGWTAVVILLAHAMVWRTH